MDLVAPSGDTDGNGDVRTTDRMGADGYTSGNYYNNFGGTSAAAPQVAGVAALMLSVNPNLTEAQVRTILQQTATDMGTSGFDNTYGYGRVNAYKAVEMALGGPISGPDLFCTTGTYSLSGTPPGSVTWSGSSGNFSVNSSTGVATRYLDGPGYVVADIASGCGTIPIKKLVYSGVPYYDHLDAEAGWLGSGQGKVLSPWGNTQMEAGYTLYIGSEAVSILEYGWEMQDHSNWYVTPLTTSSIEMNYWSLPNPNSQTIHIRARNSCGWGSYKPTYWTVSTFFAKYSVSPNPASGFVTLLFEDLIAPKGLPESLELMHESSTIPVRSLKVTGADFDRIKNNSNKLSIDVRDLSKGTYYLHVGYGDKKKPDMHRVLLE